MANELKIGWLFSNTFTLHGDRGNVLAMVKEGERRGYQVVLDEITFESKNFKPMNYDFLFMAPGQIVDFTEVLKFLLPYKKDFIEFIKTRPLLVTGTSLAFFGEKLSRADGSIVEGMGILNIESFENKAVYGDDLLFDIKYNNKEMSIIGSQIQMIDIDIKTESPFGTLSYGFGNNGKTKFEGVQKDYGIFTNTLGPLLVCNPWLTEELLNTIETFKGKEVFSKKRDNEIEEKSFKTKSRYILNKTSNLTNIQK